MPDEVAQNNDPANNENHNDQPHCRDVELQLLSQLAMSGVTLGITLFVGGCVISGLLISRLEYFRRLAEIYRKDAIPGEDSFQNLMVKYYEKVITDIEADESDELPVMIHLADVHLTLANGQQMKWNNTLWRGKIDAVDGHAIGTPWLPEDA